jgi:hypothetical protein
MVAVSPATTVHMGRLVRSRPIEVSAEVHGLADGAYDPPSGTLWVLDRSRPAVVVIDAAGKELRQWGRKGSGPGDLFVMPLVRPGHNVALVGDAVLVVDMYRLSQFTREGRFRDLIQLSGNPMALQPGVSLAPLSDSTVLLAVAQSRLTGDTSFAARATVRFYLVHLAEPKLRIDSLSYVLTSKEWYNGGYNHSGIPFYSKFGFEMGETWAVSNGELYAASYGGFGLCRMDPSTGIVNSAMQVAATPRRTSYAERLAVHAMYPGIDETNPDGTNWGRELDDHWPSTAPWYMHVVAGSRLIAASRSIGLTEDGVDLFTGTSYLGTITTPSGWLHTVITIAGDSLLRVEQDTTTDAYSLAWYHFARAH